MPQSSLPRNVAALVALATVLVVGHTGTLSPRAANAQASQEKAALILYESGRAAYRAGQFADAERDLRKAYTLAPNRYVQFYLALSLQAQDLCGEAKPHLEALAGQLSGEREEQRWLALARCLLDDVENVSQAGQCDSARAILLRLARPLPSELAERRYRLEGACELIAAERFESAGRCPDALDTIASLGRELHDELTTRRTALIERCRVSIVGFAPETPDEEAAFLLVLEGAASIRAGRHREGVASLEKARAICDQPPIRLHLAKASFSVFDCPAAVRAAREAVQTHAEGRPELERIETWCETFYVPSDAPLAEEERDGLMLLYRDSTSSIPPRLTELAETLDVYDNLRVRLWTARALLRAARWDEALPLLEGGRGRFPGDETRIARDIELARFAAADANTPDDKEKLYRDFALARTAFDERDDDRALALLRPQPKNPLSAGYLARLYARRGDCDEASAHARYAAEHTEVEPGWLASVLDTCRTSRAALDARARDRARDEASREHAERVASKRTLSYVLLGAGGVAMAGSGVFLWQHLASTDDAESHYSTYQRATTPEATASARAQTTDARDRSDAMAIGGYVTAGVGLGLLTWGVIELVQAEALEAEPTTTVVPVASDDFTGLAVQGRF